MLSLLAGTIAGVSASLVLAKRNADRLDAQQRALEERVRAAEARALPPILFAPPPGLASGAPAPATAAAAPAPSPPADESGRSPEERASLHREQAARSRAYNEERIRNHWAEPVDAKWASRSTPSLRSDLEGLAGNGGFRVADVDCRSNTCVATLEWPNRGAATERFASLGQASYGLNCGGSVGLKEEGGDPDAPTQAMLYLDCAELRKSEGASLVR